MSDLTEIKNLLRTLLKSEIPKRKKKSKKNEITSHNETNKHNEINKHINNQSQLEEVNKIDKVYNEVTKKEIEKTNKIPIIKDKLENLEEQKGIIRQAQLLAMDDDTLTRLATKLIKVEDEIRKLQNEAKRLNTPINIQNKLKYDNELESSLKNYAEALGYGIFRLENNI